MSTSDRRGTSPITGLPVITAPSTPDRRFHEAGNLSAARSRPPTLARGVHPSAADSIIPAVLLERVSYSYPS